MKVGIIGRLVYISGTLKSLFRESVSGKKRIRLEFKGILIFVDG